jgi:hypothetical protein
MLSDTDVSEDYDNDPFYQAMVIEQEVPDMDIT